MVSRIYNKRTNCLESKHKKQLDEVPKVWSFHSYLGYIDDLKESVVRILEKSGTSDLERAVAPRSLSADFNHPNKQAALNAFRSRFKRS